MMKQYSTRIWLIVALFVAIGGLLACGEADTTNTNTTNTSASTPIQQTVENSGKYDCCGVDINVNDLEATETSVGMIFVLAKVINLAPPQNAVNVGQALIFQYMAGVWTSSYQTKSVTVTVMFQGDPTGVITATLSQETEKGTQWDNSDPYGYWNVYDSTTISPSIQSN